MADHTTSRMLNEIALDTSLEKNKHKKLKMFPIEGTKNLSTDSVGNQAFKKLWEKYDGKPMSFRKMLRDEMTRLYSELKKQGRLYRRDGSRIK